ncbi:MAG: DNA-3-methyladenine glycosylase [FCB group bacterium]|nr:DNA-3-methyladenine glycosylase [FCB group bacterium]
MKLPSPLPASFFQRDPQQVAKELLGAILWHRLQDEFWLAAIIIETEAYYRREKGSHASLGFTEKRKALFMPPGTIYMYYSRGGDSFNISCGDPGDAVLIKSGFPFEDHPHYEKMIQQMQSLNKLNGRVRPAERLCAGQTLLCKSLGLKVPEWDGHTLDPDHLCITPATNPPDTILCTPRLGIPKGRDEHLPYRFIHGDYAEYCTRRPPKNTLVVRI